MTVRLWRFMGRVPRSAVVRTAVGCVAGVDSGNMMPLPLPPRWACRADEAGGVAFLCAAVDNYLRYTGRQIFGHVCRLKSQVIHLCVGFMAAICCDGHAPVGIGAGDYA